MSDRVDVNGRMAGVRGRAVRIALVAGCACILALAGCGRDEAEEALSDASIKLSSLDVGVGTRMPEGYSGKTYNEVIQAMQPLASGDGALAADAAVLLANAQRGLGIHAAADAAVREKQALHMMPGIRAQLRAWQMHNAAAAAAEAYDPASELERIDAAVRARQEEAERAREQKSQVEAQIADLLNQVADRLAKASSLRDQAGSLQLRIPGVSATEGLELAKQVRELSRQSDKLEFEARNLKNQADRLALDVQGAEVEITKLTTQAELLGQSRAAVQARAKSAQEHAARARADAEKAAVEIAERVDTGENALTPFREQQLAPATEQAVRQFETAAASAQRGTSARRSNANLALGQAQQSLGDAYWTSVLGLETYAQLMDELAAAEPPLPSAAEYASRAEDARAKANAARQAAYDAYQAAKRAYEASGASGEAGELLDQVSVRLNEISRAVGEGVVSEEALSSLEDPELAPEEDGGVEPAEAEDASDDGAVASGDDAEQIRTLVNDVMATAEAGRYGELRDLIAPATEADAALVGQTAEMLTALERLDTVTREAFGQSFTDYSIAAAESMGGGAQVLGPAQLFRLAPDEWDIRVQSDEAIALTGDHEQPELHFERIGGEWKLLLGADMFGAEEFPPEVQAQMEEMRPQIMGAAISAYAEVADGVEDGSLESNQAVLVSFQNKLQSSLMQIFQQMQGGGG